jgi:hypothetical protein
MAKKKPLVIGTSVPITEIEGGNVLEAVINVSGPNKILGRIDTGEGGHQELAEAGITEETTPAAGDFLLGFVGGAIRKMDVGNLPAGGGDVATDAIWDTKGDLAVATAANTAAALAVGTNGQVLTAASGEATGLQWATPKTVATDTIFDAKGDLAVGTAADTAAKLAVGADGLFLQAASGESTGLKYADPHIQALNAQTGTSYTLVLTDHTKLVTLSNASAITLTVPPNSSVAFAVGSVIDLAQIGAGRVTVAQGSGVTINATPGLKLRAQYSGATLRKRATDTWLLFGDLDV